MTTFERHVCTKQSAILVNFPSSKIAECCYSFLDIVDMNMRVNAIYHRMDSMIVIVYVYQTCYCICIPELYILWELLTNYIRVLGRLLIVVLLIFNILFVVFIYRSCVVLLVCVHV